MGKHLAYGSIPVSAVVVSGLIAGPVGAGAVLGGEVVLLEGMK